MSGSLDTEVKRGVIWCHLNQSRETDNQVHNVTLKYHEEFEPKTDFGLNSVDDYNMYC